MTRRDALHSLLKVMNKTADRDCVNKVTETQKGSPEQPVPCIARQPILTADENVIGYELFFRENPDQRYFNSDADQGTSAIIDSLNLMGIGVLCDGRPAFINCTQLMLSKEYFYLLSRDEVVIEIQETVQPNEEVVSQCKRLHEAGYSIALDNFVPGDARGTLVPFARFIKVDTKKVYSEDAAALVSQYGKDCLMLAHKVETRENFLNAKKCGFVRFQGYFFRHPEGLGTRQIPANQATYIRLLNAVSKPVLDFEEIELLIKHEPSLCYRLLRYLNSPVLGLSSPILSVRHALTLLGEKESAKWVRLATTLVMGQDRPSDLILSSLVRARFCELIAPKLDLAQSDLFLMGMFSLMDAILAAPIGVVLEELSLEQNIKEQLLSARTGKKTRLSPIYDLMVAREVGDWGRATQLGKQLNLSLCFIAETSNEAMRWAHALTNGLSDEAQ